MLTLTIILGCFFFGILGTVCGIILHDYLITRPTLRILNEQMKNGFQEREAEIYRLNAFILTGKT